MSDALSNDQQVQCTGYHGSQVECPGLHAMRTAFERRTTLLQLAFTAIKNGFDAPTDWVERARAELYPTADDGYNGSEPLPTCAKPCVVAALRRIIEQHDWDGCIAQTAFDAGREALTALRQTQGE